MKKPSVTNRDKHSLLQTIPHPGQPPCAITLTEDVLSLANDHEHHEYQRYRWLSLRLLSYHIDLSRLMQALAGESQQRVQALIEVSMSLQAGEPLLRDPAERDWQDQQVQQPHFLIFDDEVAARELSRAMLEEWQSQRFYARLQACNVMPDLDSWLEAFVGQARAQCQILQDVDIDAASLSEEMDGLRERLAVMRHR